MRITFVDYYPDTGYTPQTPADVPLGGTQSAFVYLAEALASRGHDVQLFTPVKEALIINNVKCIPVSTHKPELPTDVVISNSHPNALLGHYNSNAINILWCHHNSSHIHPMNNMWKVTNICDIYMMVSNWQLNDYITNIKDIRISRMKILKNAMSPFVENTQYDYITPRKNVIGFVGFPTRGLQIISRMINKIRESVPDASLEVFGSMSMYTGANSSANDKIFYNTNNPNIKFHGAISQKQLAIELGRIKVLGFTSMQTETSSIQCMEALKAGCKIISTNHGALAETTGGFAQLFNLSINRPRIIDQNEFNTNPILLEDINSEYIIGVLSAIILALQRKWDDTYICELVTQSQFATSNYTWQKRAVEFESLINSCIPTKYDIIYDISQFNDLVLKMRTNAESCVKTGFYNKAIQLYEQIYHNLTANDKEYMCYAYLHTNQLEHVNTLIKDIKLESEKSFEINIIFNHICKKYNEIMRLSRSYMKNWFNPQMINLFIESAMKIFRYNEVLSIYSILREVHQPSANLEKLVCDINNICKMKPMDRDWDIFNVYINKSISNRPITIVFHLIHLSTIFADICIIKHLIRNTPGEIIKWRVVNSTQVLLPTELHTIDDISNVSIILTRAEINDINFRKTEKSIKYDVLCNYVISPPDQNVSKIVIYDDMGVWTSEQLKNLENKTVIYTKTHFRSKYIKLLNKYQLGNNIKLSANPHAHNAYICGDILFSDNLINFDWIIRILII